MRVTLGLGYPGSPVLMLVAALSLQLAAAGAHRIGVATVSRDGQICVAIPGSAPPPGSRVTLVEADGQSALAATIGGMTPECERLERAMIAGPYYLARSGSPLEPEEGDLWVALLGTFETRLSDSGTIVLQLGTAHPRARVRSCTSSEGVHLTLWAGTPLKSERLWHQYYYLGFDVEPTCDDLEGEAGG